MSGNAGETYAGTSRKKHCSSAKLDLHVKHVESVEEVEGTRALRQQVFIGEQGVPPEMEWDALDATAYHAVALQGGVVAGTGRLVLETPTTGSIGRMAVAQVSRRQGIGTSILNYLEEEARSRGIQLITLHAQGYVREFYARHGYREEGEPFVEVGIEHVKMVIELAGSKP